MDCPTILARTLGKADQPDKFGNSWQYRSRSDRHSRVACWGILFDLLQRSTELRRHVEAGSVVFGVKTAIRAPGTSRKKDLDLVLTTPGGGGTRGGRSPRTLSDLAIAWGVRLTPEQQQKLAELPPIREGPGGTLLAAVEAKACMTAQIRQLPRMFDEFDSSQATVHAHAEKALAIGFAMVNVSDHFVSTDLNKVDLNGTVPVVSREAQPHSAQRVVDRLRELPRRTSRGGDGYDALGITVVDMANDGSPVTVVATPPAPGPDDVDSYPGMLGRFADLYDDSFGGLP